MGGYRDDADAARARVAVLEDHLDELANVAEENAALRAKLAAAEARLAQSEPEPSACHDALPPPTAPPLHSATSLGPPAPTPPKRLPPPAQRTAPAKELPSTLVIPPWLATDERNLLASIDEQLEMAAGRGRHRAAKRGRKHIAHLQEARGLVLAGDYEGAKRVLETYGAVPGKVVLLLILVGFVALLLALTYC